MSVRLVSGRWGTCTPPVFLPEEQQDQHSNSQHRQRDAVPYGIYQLHCGKVLLLRLKKQDVTYVSVSFFNVLSGLKMK